MTNDTITLEEYAQLVDKTAQFTHNDYPFFALIEEVGEVFGKLAKASRQTGLSIDELGVTISTSQHDCVNEQLREDVIKELGDVTWQLFACGKVLDVNMSELKIDNSTLTHLSQGLMRLQTWSTEVLAYAVRDNNYLQKGDVERTLESIQNICKILNIDFNHVLITNRDKLLSRLERNVIKGEGDNR